MGLDRFEVASDGRLFCPADPNKITHNLTWPTNSGSWTFVEPARGVVLHTEVGWEHNVIDEFNNPSAQASAFASVSMNGSGHVYGPIGKGWKAWTQASGNPKWRGVEHEDGGNPDKPFTDAQMDWTAAFVEACSHRDGFPIQITDDPNNGTGVICHVDGGAAWGGHSCPGPVRMAQRPEIVRRALALAASRKSPPPPNPAPAPVWTMKENDMDILLKGDKSPQLFQSDGKFKLPLVSMDEAFRRRDAGQTGGSIVVWPQADVDRIPVAK